MSLLIAVTYVIMQPENLVSKEAALEEAPLDRFHCSLFLLCLLHPHVQDPEFAVHLEPFRSQKGVHFHAPSLRGELQCSHEEGCIAIDLGMCIPPEFHLGF